MEHLEQAIELNEKAREDSGEDKLQLLVLAVQQQCLDLREELLKIRKELRTRNGGNDASS